MTTTKETKHTPIPWTLDEKRRCIYSGPHMIASCWLPREVSDAREPGESWLDMQIRTEPERDAVDAEEKANAAFIVRAVNNHAQLVDALQKVEARLTAAARAFYVTGKRGDLQNALDGWVADAEAARATLAKLKP